MSINEKINVAVVGVGSIAHSHINAYLNNDAVNLVAFCDINSKQLHDMGEQYGVTKLYTDINDMLKEEDLDAVSICTWNTSHADCAITALDAGLNVLSEKPMATSVDDALSMQEAANRNNKTLMIGFVRRFGNDTKILEKFIESGFMGDIYYAKAQYLRRHGNPGGWFSDKSRSGGGPLIDLGVHVIDLVRYLMGNPKVISVYGATFSKLASRNQLTDQPPYTSVSRGADDVNDVEDLATAMIRFENGAVLSLETSFSLNIKEDVGSIEIFGDKGGAKLDPEIQLFTDMNGHLTDVSFHNETALNFDGLFENEIDHFVDVVMNGTECKAPAKDGVEMMRILDAIYESARTGHEVILEEGKGK